MQFCFCQAEMAQLFKQRNKVVKYFPLSALPLERFLMSGYSYFMMRRSKKHSFLFELKKSNIDSIQTGLPDLDGLLDCN